MTELKKRITVEDNPLKWYTARRRSKETQSNYYGYMRLFMRSIYRGEGLVTDYSRWKGMMGEFIMPQHMVDQRRDETEKLILKYIDELRADKGWRFSDDIRGFIDWMNDEEYALKTTNGIVRAVMKFFTRYALELEEIEKGKGSDFLLREIEREDIRGLLPRNVRTVQSHIPNKTELRMILQYLSVQHRAVTLFLCNTGCRIGEAFSLRPSELNLDHDPPYADITPKKAKGGSGRRVYFTKEAKDAIEAWHRIKDVKRKGGAKGWGLYPKNAVFGFTSNSFNGGWNNALKKAGLDQRESVTKKRFHNFHPHTLRMWFNTQLSNAKMPYGAIEKIMGHAMKYEGAYHVYSQRDLERLYVEYQDAVTVYEQEGLELLRKKTEEFDNLAEKYNDVKVFIEYFNESIMQIPELEKTVGEQLIFIRRWMDSKKE